MREKRVGRGDVQLLQIAIFFLLWSFDAGRDCQI